MDQVGFFSDYSGRVWWKVSILREVLGGKKAAKVTIELDPDSPKNIGILAESGPVRYLPGKQYQVYVAQLDYLKQHGVKYRRVLFVI